MVWVLFFAIAPIYPFSQAGDAWYSRCNEREMGECVSDKTSTAKTLSTLVPPPEGWRFKVILYTALVVGAIGAGIGYIEKGSAINSISMGVGLPMVMAPYFVVPRTKTLRIWQGSITGALSGIVAMLLLLLFATDRFTNHWAIFGTSILQFLIMSVGISWLSVVLSDWTEKRRLKIEAKREAETPKLEKHYPKKQRLRAPKQEDSGHTVRVHRYNKKEIM